MLKRVSVVAAIVVSLAVHAAAWFFLQRSVLGVRPAHRPKLEVSRVELSAGGDEEKSPRAAEETEERAAGAMPVPRLPAPETRATSVKASPVEMKIRSAPARVPDPPPVEVRMTTSAPSPERAHVEAPAAPVKAISPKYPRGARRRGEEGVVEARVRVEADGTVSSLEILKSSGYPELDEAAREAVMNALFAPAKSGGTNVSSTAAVSLRFRLR